MVVMSFSETNHTKMPMEVNLGFGYHSIKYRKKRPWHHHLFSSSFAEWVNFYILVNVCYLVWIRRHFNAILHGSKNSILETKNCNIFLIYGPNINCGCLLEPSHWGGSNKDPQSMFVKRNNRNNVYPCKPTFPYIKWDSRGCSLHGLVNVTVNYVNSLIIFTFLHFFALL